MVVGGTDPDFGQPFAVSVTHISEQYKVHFAPSRVTQPHLEVKAKLCCALGEETDITGDRCFVQLLVQVKA